MAKRRYASQNRLLINEYRGACEGNQEYLYFEHLKYLIRNEQDRKFNVDFKFSNVGGGSSVEVVKAANKKSTGDFKNVAIFDYDAKIEEYKKALDLCKEYSIEHGYSNFSFDLWLILHKNKYLKAVSSAAEYKSEIISRFELPSEVDIKEEEIIKRILAKIDFNDVKRAIMYGKEIIEENKQIKTPNYTSKSILFYENPDVSIHSFVEKVIKDAGLII